MDKKDMNEELKNVINGLILASLDLKCDTITSFEVYSKIHRLFKKGLHILSPVVDDNELQHVFNRLFSENKEDDDLSDFGSCFTDEDIKWTPPRIVVSSSTVCSSPLDADSSSFGFLNNNLFDNDCVSKVSESDADSVNSIPILRERVSETDYDEDDLASSAGSLTYYGDVNMEEEECVRTPRKRFKNSIDDDLTVKRPRYSDLLSTPIIPNHDLFGSSSPFQKLKSDNQMSADDTSLNNEYSSNVLAIGYFPMKFSSEKMLFGSSYTEKKIENNSSKIYRTHKELFDDLLYENKN